jgi:hypothetical protein
VDPGRAAVFLSAVAAVVTGFIVFVLAISTTGTTELHREVTSASSPAACQTHADKLAEEQRRKHAATLQRMGAIVRAHCQPLGVQP